MPACWAVTNLVLEDTPLQPWRQTLLSAAAQVQRCVRACVRACVHSSVQVAWQKSRTTSSTKRQHSQQDIRIRYSRPPPACACVRACMRACTSACMCAKVHSASSCLAGEARLRCVPACLRTIVVAPCMRMSAQAGEHASRWSRHALGRGVAVCVSERALYAVARLCMCVYCSGRLDFGAGRAGCSLRREHSAHASASADVTGPRAAVPVLPVATAVRNL